MTRRGFDEDDGRPLQEAQGARCIACRNDAPHAELAHFGGRCDPCFQAYCREGSDSAPARPLTRDDKVAIIKRLGASIARATESQT